MAWDKEIITIEDGSSVSAQAPEIISASRSTDIPAFYADWFFNRLKVGYSAWINPFNGVKSYVSYKHTRFIVFWSKNPRPLLEYLDYLKERNIGCYIQYSLNDYEKERLERGVPPIQGRIDTFKRIVDKLGHGRVIWRFDPLILTNEISQEVLLEKIRNIGNQLKDYTEKLVFSFADILAYRKVKANLERDNIQYHEWQEDEMIDFAGKLSLLNKSEGWNYRLATCGERLNPGNIKEGRRILQDKFGIEPNRCVDDELIIRFSYNDKKLMDFLNVKFYFLPQPDMFGKIESLPSDAIVLPNGMYATRGNNKDNGQRQFCGCIVSKDIGQYNTCIHNCEYCYANISKTIAKQNYLAFRNNPFGESIIG